MDSHEKRTLRKALLLSGIFVGLLWLIELWEYTNGVSLSFLGIFPRTLSGLKGILTAPLIHGDWGHLWSNTGPLFVTGLAILYLYKDISLRVITWIYLMTGIWVWIGAYPAYHIGASGLVYGFAAFLFFSGLLRREKRSIAISLLVAFLYGGMVWGIFPGQKGISWESHLFGAIAGTSVAFVMRKKGPQRKKYSWEEEEDEYDPRDEYAVWNYQNQMPPPPRINYEYTENQSSRESD